MRKVSNSEIQSFKRCRRKWWLQWFQGWAPKRDDYTSVRSTGTRLHAALAAYYNPDPQDLLYTLRQAQNEDLITASVDPNADESALNGVFDLERIMLEGYQEWLADTGADSYLIPLSSETYVERPFPGDVLLIGKVDARVQDSRTGETWFIDHKSTASLDTRLLRMNEQMKTYALLLEENHRPAGALWNLLRRVKRSPRAKPPFYHREEVRINQHERDSFYTRLRGVITGILATEDALNQGAQHPDFLVYPTPTRDCAWDCPFVSVCPMFDDGSRVEAALEAQFVRQDPLSYYEGKEQEE